jgi:hypothetical protein
MLYRKMYGVKRRLVLLAVAGVLLCAGVYLLTWPHRAPQAESVKMLVSNPYRLDKIYHSMEGPWSVQTGIDLTARRKSRVVWVTGLETEIVDAAEQKPISQEFFCHSNLTLSERSTTPVQYNQRFGGRTHLDWRLFTLVPGRLSLELPQGFGIPVPAGVPLDYATMSLNLNVKNEVVNVRMRTKIHTIADDQPGTPTKALFRRALYVLQPQGETGNVEPPDIANAAPQHVGAGCARFCRVNLSAVSSVGKLGEGQTIHWFVPTGHHVYRTEITPQLSLPFDTTIHYATIHVHPFARGMPLRDLTTGGTILRFNSRDWADRLGIAHVDEFKSIEGIPVFRDHRYELTAEYDNTLESKTDAMAILYLYLLEKNLT